MVALFLPDELARQFALEGGEPVEQLHVTLAFLGDAEGLGDPEALQALVGGWAAATAPLEGEISGVGLFTAGPEAVTYLSLDVPELPEARQMLSDLLVLAGQPISTTHGFTPHCTLDYADRTGEVTAGGEAVQFGAVSVVVGTERTDYRSPALAGRHRRSLR
jgi:2'-5' RNA ligase